jgi:hypothetical protein
MAQGSQLKTALLIVGLLVVAGCLYWCQRDDGKVTVDSVTYTKALAQGGVYTASLHTRKVDYILSCSELTQGATCFPLLAGTRHTFKDMFGKAMMFEDQWKDTQVWTIVTQKVR